MRGSRNFRQGGGGGGVQVNLTKKALTFFFFVFFFVLSLFYDFTEVKWLISKKTIIFQCSRGGPTFFQGGSNFFQEGSNCLFPIETHKTCDFPGGGGPDPLSPPPLDPHLALQWPLFKGDSGYSIGTCYMLGNFMSLLSSIEFSFGIIAFKTYLS